jgi:hypothetical protein
LAANYRGEATGRLPGLRPESYRTWSKIPSLWWIEEVIPLLADQLTKPERRANLLTLRTRGLLRNVRMIVMLSANAATVNTKPTTIRTTTNTPL